MKKVFTIIKNIRTLYYFAIIIFCSWSVILKAKINIDITQGNTQVIPVAVVPFLSDSSQLLPVDVATVISNDLKLSGQFSPVSSDSFLSFPSNAKDIYFPDWKKLKVKYLLIGRIKKLPSGNYRIEYDLFNVDTHATIFSGLIEGQKGQLRPLSHGISDQVYQQITGMRGIFSTKLLYVCAQRRESPVVYKLVYADIDGHRPVTIVSSSQPIMSPTWSPDRKRVAYTTYTKNSQQIIYIQELATQKRQIIVQGYAMSASPVFSPDGTMLAMALSKGKDSHIYIKNLQTGELKQITFGVGTLDAEPDWMPDGQNIVFTSNRDGSAQIYKIDLKSKKVIRLTFENGFNARAKVFPDGYHIAIVTKRLGEKAFNIAVLNVKTGVMQIISDHPLEDSPCIAPNGKMLIFSSFSKERYILEMITTNGAVSYNFPAMNCDAQEPAWSPF
ncbi:MAG: Tol-Pal system beta propeller repeat protein TolB [Endozoicomonadaceae bacterium]|nr:Tol-Pal system beta propeller repeat protein TolB [Endozoicomonadaceae bacterium]